MRDIDRQRRAQDRIGFANIEAGFGKVLTIRRGLRFVDLELACIQHQSLRPRRVLDRQECRTANRTLIEQNFKIEIHMAHSRLAGPGERMDVRRRRHGVFVV